MIVFNKTLVFRVSPIVVQGSLDNGISIYHVQQGER